MKIKFSVDPQYRRELFLEGFDVDSSYELDCPAAELTKPQRQFILNLTQGNTEGVPAVVLLVTPTYSTEQSKIIHEFWLARIHPNPYGLGEIIDTWINDYQRRCKEAQAERDNKNALPDLFNSS